MITNKKPNILVTGGAGYIGLHTVVALTENGFNVIIADDFSNSNKASYERMSTIIGVKPLLYECDIRHTKKLDQIFIDHKIDAVIHFAGLKSVDDSIASPCKYFDCNISCTVSLIDSMERAGIKKIIFSSTASVYGDTNDSPISEDAKIDCKSAYAFTKYSGERLLGYQKIKDEEWSVVILRYFNPIGAHISGLIGEESKNPTNLMPRILKVASGEIDELEIYGNDYDTSDGTGVRDYIHVMDLAEGHVASLQYLLTTKKLSTLNLGSGKGFSVLEIIEAFERVNNVQIPYKFLKRRKGDAANVFADASLAKELLDWSTKKSIDLMCNDSWLWYKNMKKSIAQEDDIH